MTPDQEKYALFCGSAPDLPVFMHPWYLDAVCGGPEAWSVILLEKASRVVGAWPMLVKRKGPWSYVSMPPLARLMGPYLLPEFRTLAKEPGLVEEFLDQLPPLAAFEQDCHYGLQNWLPFYWRGFRQTTRYSYVLDVTDLTRVWDGLASDYRNRKIPAAQAQVRVHTGDDLAEFYRVHNLSFSRQGLQPPFSFDFLQKLDAALVARQSRAIFFAHDLETGAVHAVAYLIWDKHSAYYLLAGDDPALRQSGAGVLVAWEAIRYTREVLGLPVFDFAGSMIRPIERVRRQFGAQQQPYFRLQKEWSVIWKWGKWLRG